MPTRTKPRGFRFPGGRNAAAPAATSGFSLPTPLPFTERATAFWRAGNYAGSGPLLDLTGNGHDLTINGPTFLNDEAAAYVYLPGVASNYLSVPDEAAFDITGDIDIRVKVAADDWSPSTGDQSLISRYTGVAASSPFLFMLTSTGTLLTYFSVGGALVTPTSTAAVSFTGGDAQWLRVTRASSSGSVNYYTSSDDGSTWTKLGATVASTAGALPATNTGISVCGWLTGLDPFGGRFYRAVIKDGIDGTTVLDVNTAAADPASTTFAATTGQTVTINRSAAGRKAVVVEPGRPVFLFGTDDYMTTPDAADLDFAAPDNGTLAVVFRDWGATQGTLLDKSYYSVLINGDSSNDRVRAIFFDGTDIVDYNTSGANATADALNVVAVVINRPGAYLYDDGALLHTGVDINAIGSMANASAFFVGRDAGGTAYADMEFVGAAIVREALNADELRQLAYELTS